MNWLKRFISKIVHSKPTMYSSSVILNLMGWHWIRIAVFYLWRILRIPQPVSIKYAGYVEELKKNGVVAIPNFFPDEDFKLIQEAFDSLMPEFSSDPSEIGLPHVERMNIHDKRVPGRVQDLITENDVLKNVSRIYLNREYHFPIQAYLTRIYCSEEEVSLPKNGGTNNLHFDAPLRVLKAFYYVSDTTKDNAPFTYCYKSFNRFDLKRLLFEYMLSIRYALNRWNPKTRGEYTVGEPWVTITDKEKKDNNLIEVPVTGKANTLVIVNTGGFHRRGAFLKGGERRTIEINYRSMDTLRNNFYDWEKELRVLFGKQQAELQPTGPSMA